MTTTPTMRVRPVLGGLIIFCGAVVALPVTSAHAAGPYIAERRMTVTTGGTGTEDLISGIVTWPYEVGAQTCGGEWSDYFMVFRGPYWWENGSKDRRVTAEVGVQVRHAKPGLDPGDPTLDRVIRYCERCSSVLEDIAVYSPVHWATVNYDTVNQRWIWYVDGTPVLSEGWASTHLKEANLLRVGGQVEEHSELGPFLHRYVKIRRASTPSQWNGFIPGNTTGQLLHSPPPSDRDLMSTYVNESVAVLTFGSITCP